MALSRITEAVASFTDLTIGDDLTLTDDLLLASDANIIKFGADAEVTLTHVHNTGLLLNSTSVIQFNDASQNIGAPSATVLDINATDEIELNATLIDVNGNLDVSGTIVGASTISGTTITATTAFVPDASDGAALGTTALEFSDLFLADGAVISLGDDDDVTLTHVADTGILLNGTNVIQFNDASQNIGAPSATILDINATDEIELNATLVDVNANLDVSGTLNVQGETTLQTHLNMGDGDIIKLGDSADLQISHTGSFSKIADSGTGNLILACQDFSLTNPAVGENMITAVVDGAVTLYHDNTAKIATSSTGVNVTGAITSTGTIQGTTITATTAFVPDASDGAALGTTALEFSDLFLADASTIQFGADQDVTLTHVADTGILLNSTMKLQFRDAAIHISSTADGDLSIAADDEIDLTSTLIDINGNATVSGTLGVTGIATFTDDIEIGDGKQIGTVSDNDAITIAANGQVTFTQTLIGTALDISGDIDIDGTSNLDIIDVDGAANFAADVTIATGADIITASAGTSNTRVGVNTGNSIASGGNYNVFVGDEAGTATTTGDNNVAIGYAALDAATASSNLTAVGYNALTALTATGDRLDTAVGAQALAALTDGFHNVAVGYASLDALTHGERNIAVGRNALGSDTKGNYNTAIGDSALATQNFTSDTDAYNTAVGYKAGIVISTGIKNTIMGGLAGDVLTDADFNVAVGYGALSEDHKGNKSTAIGAFALEAQEFANSTDSLNTAVGYKSGSALSTGSQNTAVGTNSLIGVVTGIGNSVYGLESGNSITSGAYNTFIGRYTADSCTTGSYNTHVGNDTDTSTNAIQFTIAIGHGAVDKGTNTGFLSSNSGIYQGNNSTAWTATSDRRIKKNIVDNTTGLAKINAIKIRSFDYRTVDEITDFENPKVAVVEVTGTKVGVIAQEIKEVLPDVVIEQSTGILSVDPTNLTWYLINAVQELSAKVKALEDA